jgi:predicted dehydrogenase
LGVGVTGLAIVGLGLAVEPHALSLAELADVAPVRWAVSRSPERLRSFAERHPFPTTTDLDRALRDPAVEAVLLLTPPNTHGELGRAVLAAGKHLLVEKPLEISLGPAEALVQAAERADRRLGVVLQHRFRPGALRLKALLDAGGLGAVQAATAVVPWWRPQSYYDEPGRGVRARDGGGVLLTQAIHTLDLFRSLVGPLAVIAAETRTTALHRMETEDLAAAIVRLGEGGLGSVFATTAFFPGSAERIEVIGALGSAQLVGGALSVHWLDGRTETLADEGPTGGGADPMAFSHRAHRRLIEDFLEAVRTGRSPLASGREALITQRLIAELSGEADLTPAA